jgi:tetratricopeptide (TPR) repeat protein
MGNLAEGYRAAGQRDRALPLYEETLKLTKAKLGPDHPDTLRSMNNLAGGYRAAGKLDRALPLYEETLKLTKAKLGPDHPDTLRSMNNLAAGYWSTGKLDRSVPLFEDALKLQKAKLGADHPDTLQTMANLGVNYKDAGRLAEALPLLEDAARAGRTRPRLRWVQAQLQDAYLRAGQTAQAAALAREQLAEARTALPAGSPRLAGVLAQAGQTLVTAQAWAEAEPVLRECLTIREKQQPDAWTLFNTRSLLGAALLGQQTYADAEPLLLAGFAGVKQRAATMPPQARPRLAEAAERLVRLYEATGKPAEAAKWRAELVDVQWAIADSPPKP